ncbi:hypothetical protein Y032_0480g2234 [Ancylostoma ceylanicum]|uniref:Phenazine biosynthesis protein, PhzF family n=1 Tax=Ancylostoma ceylanicum TaxID=53326 RepID=A0A016WW21_9BILA|nr:hypothetical protein Y032_0480g2234 [Ancylostoma ceylanicum]
MVEKHPTYIVDAFTSERFAGNQAAVCLIPRVLRDEEYRKIAAEFNLSETAFPIPTNGDFKTASSFTLRWFTPTTEVPLCGHATLATSHVLFNEIGNESAEIKFATKSGELIVQRRDHGHVEMDFPQYHIAVVRFIGAPNPLSKLFSEFDAPSHINDLIDCIIPSSINVESVAYASEAKKLIIVVDKQTTKQTFFPNIVRTEKSRMFYAGERANHSEAMVRKGEPAILQKVVGSPREQLIIHNIHVHDLDDFRIHLFLRNFELSEITTKNCNKMKALDPDGDFVRGVLVTLAPANAKIQGFTDCEDEPYDYVCRYFAPWVGINEDPATGSAQCALAPFWAAVLGKPVLYAFQSYPNRGAQFRLQLRDSNRLALLGKSVTVLQGQLFLNEAVFY